MAPERCLASFRRIGKEKGQECIWAKKYEYDSHTSDI
jgi:hypothetical protein